MGHLKASSLRQVPVSHGWAIPMDKYHIYWMCRYEDCVGRMLSKVANCGITGVCDTFLELVVILDALCIENLPI